MIGSILALVLTFAQVPFIYDGDTLYYHHTGLRLHGIDAPEMNAKYGAEARDALRGYLAGKDLDCQDQGDDKYNRRLVLCKAGGDDISKWMVRNGWAIAYTWYSNDYVADEAYARQHRLGMFADDPAYTYSHVSSKSGDDKASANNRLDKSAILPLPAK